MKKIVQSPVFSGISQSDIDNYQAMQDKYKNTRFADILAANPYLNVSRTPSGWEKFLGSLGFRTGYDRDIDQQNQAFRDYNAQVAQLASEDEYNSPAAAAERMRVAGLNPDLQGIGNVAQAGEFAQDQTSPEFSGADDPLGSLGSLARVALGVFSTTTGLLKDFASLREIQQSFESGDIDNASKMLDFAFKSLGFLDSEQNGDSSLGNSWDQMTEFLSSNISPFLRSKKNRNNFATAINSGSSSLDRTLEHYSNRAKAAAARTEDAGLRSSQYFSVNNEMFEAMLRPIIKAAEDLSYKKNTFEKSKLDNLDPALAAQAENAEAENKVQERERNIDTNQVLNQIIHNLAENAKSGDRASGFALLLWSIFRERIGVK